MITNVHTCRALILEHEFDLSMYIFQCTGGLAHVVSLFCRSIFGIRANVLSHKGPSVNRLGVHNMFTLETEGLAEEMIE